MLKVKLFIWLLVWLALIGFGFWALARYETTAGAEADPPIFWPAQSQLKRDTHGPTLVMMLHPHCPCSRSSLNELAALLDQYSQKVRAIVVFIKPEGVKDGWEKTGLWRQASGINGVEVFCDDHEKERQLFGAKTSGQVLLYDMEGRLQCSTGITLARGQSGVNQGRLAIIANLKGESSMINSIPVFGCPLVDPESCSSEKGNACPDLP